MRTIAVSVLVSVGFSFCFAPVRGTARNQSQLASGEALETSMDTGVFRDAACSCASLLYVLRAPSK